MSAGWRHGSASLPTELHHRPLYFVQHMTDANLKAAEITSEMISQVGDTCYKVQSATTTDRSYEVHLGDDVKLPFCECRQFIKQRMPCKHFCAIFNHVPGVSFDSLPQRYRDHPLFTVDDDCTAGQLPSSSFLQSDHDDAQLTASFDTLPVDSVDNSSVPTVSGPSVNTCAAHCRESLKQLVDLTYLCSDTEPLLELNTTLIAALTVLQQQMPNDGGLPLNTARMKGSKHNVQSAGLTRIPVRHQKRAANKRRRRPPPSQHVDIELDDSQNADDKHITIVLQHSSEHPANVDEQSAAEDSCAVAAVNDIQSCNSNDNGELETNCVTDATSARPERHSADISCLQDNLSQQLLGSSSLRKRKPASLLPVRSEKKKVRFADIADKPSVTIENYFVKTNQSSPGSRPSASAQCQHSVQSDLSHLVSFVPNVLKVTKASVIACCKECSGQPMSCGNVTLCQDDLLSLLPGKQIIDNVSLVLHLQFFATMC